MSSLKSREIPVEQVPVLYARGTNYQVGFSIGKTFCNVIKEFLREWGHFSEVLLPAYQSQRGRQIYEDTLATCDKRYPKYVEELKGTALGAGVEFHKLFLLHIEGLVDEPKDKGDSFGCTAVLSNADRPILGHTEDGTAAVLNRFFIVSAQILNDEREIIENFSTLTYPGYLPGCTMGFNRHGLVYSVNAICPSKTYPGRTPEHFLARAVLGAKTTEEVVTILEDKGVGVAGGLTLNLIMLKNGTNELDMANIEVGPNRGEAKESELSIHWVEKGANIVHCNRYLRLDIPELQGGSIRSSSHRHAAIDNLPPPNTVEDVKNILSDQADKIFPVYRNSGFQHASTVNSDEARDYASTLAVGIFDMDKRTWSIYTNPPATSEPVVVLPLNFNVE